MKTPDCFLWLCLTTALLAAFTIDRMCWGAEHQILCTYPDAIKLQHGNLIQFPCEAPCIYDDTDHVIGWGTGETLCNLQSCGEIPLGTQCMFQWRDPRTATMIIPPAVEPHTFTVVAWPYCTVDGQRTPLDAMRPWTGTLTQWGFHP